MADPRRVSICGVPVLDVPDSRAAIAAIEAAAPRDGEGPPLQVNFINAHVVNIALSVPEFLGVLRSCAINLTDGIGVWLGGRILAGADLANLNGTDFGVEILKWGAAAGRRFFFLGAKEGVAEAARDKLAARIPGLRVVGCRNGYLDEASSAEAVRQIVESGADVLFVCMGVPGQELWISRHLAELKGVELAFGLGAFFDFYAEIVARSPAWMRKARIEWVYRLLQEPRRLWKRYLVGNFVFMWHVMACKVSSLVKRPEASDRGAPASGEPRED